jgi:hypothetical protein
MSLPLEFLPNDNLVKFVSVNEPLDMFNMRRFQNMLLKVFPWLNYFVKEPFTFGVISIFVKLFKGAVSFHLMPFFKVAFLQNDILSTLC